MKQVESDALEIAQPDQEQAPAAINNDISEFVNMGPLAKM
jgi:hypothetical protein